jgi:hypothetical protein
MKICALVPSEEHMKQGGVRIRYRRIQKELQDLGHELQVGILGELASAPEHVYDVYIISKCYDAAAILFAVHLKNSGKLLGIDLFDDYFSQFHDSRFIGRRLWLHSLAPLADFILVSTPAMQSVTQIFAPGKPVHVMNDPSPPLCGEAIKAAIRHKLKKLDEEKLLHVGWFGLGDNPHFPVGLTDLVAFGPELAELSAQGWNVRLAILTNERAMTADRLTMLRRLPVPWTIEVWTEEREAALLARSLVSFLPVNAQNFSVVKSLNRAVSSLAAGTQVFSTGYPLYHALSPFIYRDPAKLRRDIEMRTLALREETVDEFLHKMTEFGSIPIEARKLGEFLTTQYERMCDSTRLASICSAVIHGKESSSDVHKIAQKLGALSVASPFASGNLNYDVKFSFPAGGAGLEVLIAEEHCPRLPNELRSVLHAHGKELQTDYKAADFSQLVPDVTLTGQALATANSTFAALASYAHVMNLVEKALRRLFPGIYCYYSEQSKIPFWTLPVVS